MAKNEKQEWITTKIPKDIADEIEILIKNKKLGYNSKTGFISDALREKIDQLSGKSKKQQTKLEDKINDIHTNVIEMKKAFAKFYSSDDERMTIDEMLKKISSPEYKKQMEIEEEQKIKDIREIAGSEYVPLDTTNRKKLDIPFNPPNLPKIELIVKEKDHVVLIDHTKERIVEVVITNGAYFCNLCEEKNCVHIGFVFSLPDGHKKLGKKLTKTV